MPTILATLIMFALGWAVIRLIGWQLPAPRNAREYLLSVFWIYPATIPREVIVRNRIAWLAVLLITYVVITAFFF